MMWSSRKYFEVKWFEKRCWKEYAEIYYNERLQTDCFESDNEWEIWQNQLWEEKEKMWLISDQENSECKKEKKEEKMSITEKTTEKNENKLKIIEFEQEMKQQKELTFRKMKLQLTKILKILILKKKLKGTSGTQCLT